MVGDIADPPRGIRPFLAVAEGVLLDNVHILGLFDWFLQLLRQAEIG